MKNPIKTEISLDQALEVVQRSKENQSAKLKEFKDSNTELFDFNDYLYYSEETGKTIPELKAINPPKDIYNFIMSSDCGEELLELFI